VYVVACPIRVLANKGLFCPVKTKKETLIARCIISNSFTHYFEASTSSHPAGTNGKHNSAKPMTQNTPKK
jgi:hypothetical protein